MALPIFGLRFFYAWKAEVMTDSNPQESLADLIRQAQRTHEIIEAVDFDKLKAHDSEEVAKLEGVSEALGKLSDGEQVARVDGVDEVDNIDPTFAIKNELMMLLDESGLGERLGRVFGLGLGSSQPGSKSADIVPHREGLPAFDVVLAPNYAPADGAHGIFISYSGVFSAHVAEPITRHHWKILRSQPYDDNEELISIVQRYLDPAD